MKPFIYLIIVFSFVILFLFFFYAHSLVRSEATHVPEKEADYMIVLGARVIGEKPSLSLQYRIDTAATYLKENKKTMVIVSGGQGDGENISEAEAMKRALLQQGISEERIIMEDQSTSTIENVRFSKKLLQPHMEKGIIVSNDYHMYRALQIAKGEGLHVETLPAPTPTIALPKSYAREYLAILKYKMMHM